MNYTIEITRFEQKTEKYISSTETVEAVSYMEHVAFTTFYDDSSDNVASFPNHDIISIKSMKK